MNEKPLAWTQVYLQEDTSTSDFVRVWAVDAKGNLLHTDPVCLVSTAHFWFWEWLRTLECPQEMPAIEESDDERKAATNRR